MDNHLCKTAPENGHFGPKFGFWGLSRPKIGGFGAFFMGLRVFFMPKMPNLAPEGHQGPPGATVRAPMLQHPCRSCARPIW